MSKGGCYALVVEFVMALSLWGRKTPVAKKAWVASSLAEQFKATRNCSKQVWRQEIEQPEEEHMLHLKTRKCLVGLLTSDRKESEGCADPKERNAPQLGSPEAKIEDDV